MNIYSQGIAGDGPCILWDGEPMTPEQIVKQLNEKPPIYSHDLVKGLQQRVVELTIELSQHKEAIHNFMSMGHAGEQDEVVKIFMDEYLPDDETNG